MLRRGEIIRELEFPAKDLVADSTLIPLLLFTSLFLAAFGAESMSSLESTTQLLA